MAKAAPSIALNVSRDIPFNLLVLAQSNVRQVKSGLSIEELAEDIARRGLLQGLNVRPVIDASGTETGRYEVPAGGRRFRALERLVKQKRLTRTAPVPCIVRDPASAILAEDDSLAENTQRVALHPLDQFRAFQALKDKGQSEEDIAAAFFITAAVVRQRLRLAAVAPSLLDVYAADEMSLDQLMAFTISNDHARQEQVWASLGTSYGATPHLIRRALTETQVRASDRRALFVGQEAYTAAGGTIIRDLFEDDRGGWLEDPALLDRLVTEKLAATASTVEAEGWKWVESALDLPYGFGQGLRVLQGTQNEGTEAERATVEALTAEAEGIEREYEDADVYPDEAIKRLDEIETILHGWETRPRIFDPAEMAIAGAYVSVAGDGTLQVERGFVRPEDETPQAGAGGDTAAIDEEPGTTPAKSPSGPATAPGPSEEDEATGDKPLSDTLLSELSAHRSLALRDALAQHPHVAMTALLHKLVHDVFDRMGYLGGCLDLSVRPVAYPLQAPGLKDSAAARSVEARHEAWGDRIPADDAARWSYLNGLSDAERMDLLAHCVSYGVNALHEKVDRYGGAGLSAHGLDQRLGAASRLAEAVDLDMVAAGWMPTVELYLGRVTKPRILSAVREAKGEAAAQLIDHLKKADMAREAERLLTGSGWLPEALRRAGATGDGDSLPAFLSGDDTDQY